MSDSFGVILLFLLVTLALAVVWTSGEAKNPPRGDCMLSRYSIASPATGNEWLGVTVRTCTDRLREGGNGV